MKKYFRFVIAVCGLITLSSNLFADDRATGYDIYGPVTINTTGSDEQSFLIGTIRDQNGIAIASAEVTITGMYFIHLTQTNSQGKFYLGNINLAQVNINANKEGYQTVHQSMLIVPGPNYTNLIMPEEEYIPQNIVLSDSLTIYADNIDEYMPDRYQLEGNVNINGVLAFTGIVRLNMTADHVYPQITIWDEMRGINIDEENPTITIDPPLYLTYKVIDNQLVPINFECFVEASREVSSYKVEIGRLTIGQNDLHGKYVECMCLLKKQEDDFFSKLMDIDNWFAEDEKLGFIVTPDLYLPKLKEISVSFIYGVNSGVSTGCDISGLSCNLGVLSVEDLSLWIDPIDDVFGGSLKLKIPGVGKLGGHGQNGLSVEEMPVTISDPTMGKTINTDLAGMIEMQQRGIFHNLEFEVLMEFTDGGQWNSFAISLSGMDIPIFNTGTYIREIHGGVYDRMVNDMKVEASIDVGLHSDLDIGTLGPFIYIDDLGAVIKPWYYFEGSGDIQVFKHTMAGAKFYYDAKKECMSLEGRLQLTTQENDPGSAIIEGKLYGNLSGPHFNAGLQCQLKTPDDLPWYLNWAENWRIADFEASIKDMSLSGRAQLYGLSLATRLTYGKETFPYFHFYIGRNFRHLYTIFKGSRNGRQAIDFQVPENTGQIFAVSGNDSNLFDFTLTDPNGTVYDSAYGGYHTFPSSLQSVMVIDYPIPGTWSYATSQEGHIFTEFQCLDQQPTKLVSMPDRQGSRNNNIRLDLTDYSDTLNVRVFYDTDNKNFDGTLIQEFNVMNNADIDFNWHNGDIPDGEYYIYSSIDDGSNSPVLQYAPGSIIVDNVAMEVPQNVTAVVASDSLLVAWNDPADENIIVTEISIRDRYNKRDFSYAVTAENRCSINDVAAGREYEVRCRFGDAENNMGDYSAPLYLLYSPVLRNNPPYFTMDPDSLWVFVANQPGAYHLRAADPEGGSVSYSLLQGENGMNVNGNLFSWTPSSLQAGMYLQQIIASDGACQDTLVQQMAVLSEEQAQPRVKFSSYNLYEEDNMFVRINNPLCSEYYQNVTLTNQRTGAQIIVQCRRVNDLEYIGQLTISEYARTDLPVMDGDNIQASYSYGTQTINALSIYSSNPQPYDQTPPAAVSDLQAAPIENGTLKLIWTATGDNGNEGRAYKYDLRFSYVEILDSDDFLVANQIEDIIYPSSSGCLDSLVINLADFAGIAQYDSLFFALVVQDARQNRSGVSNCAAVCYLTSPGTVNAVLADDANTLVTWTDVSRSYGPMNRGRDSGQPRQAVNFSGYRLTRMHNGTQTVLAETLAAPSYADNITGLGDGSLSYGVQAVYSSGNSAVTLSNILDLDRLLELRILCQQDSLLPAAGVGYVITGQDSLYQQSYSGQTNVSGMILLDDVYKTTYQVRMNKPGCFSATYLLDVSDQYHEFILDIYSAIPPEVIETDASGSNAILGWDPVPGALYYKIYASDEPYATEWGGPISIIISTGSYQTATVPLIGNRRFFRITAGGDDE